jgi:hypothetical protein
VVGWLHHTDFKERREKPAAFLLVKINRSQHHSTVLNTARSPRMEILLLQNSGEKKKDEETRIRPLPLSDQPKQSRIQQELEVPGRILRLPEPIELGMGRGQLHQWLPCSRRLTSGFAESEKKANWGEQRSGKRRRISPKRDTAATSHQRESGEFSGGRVLSEKRKRRERHRESVSVGEPAGLGDLLGARL